MTLPYGTVNVTVDGYPATLTVEADADEHPVMRIEQAGRNPVDLSFTESIDRLRFMIVFGSICAGAHEVDSDSGS